MTAEPTTTETTQREPTPVFRGIDDEASRAVRALRQALDEAHTRLHQETEEAPA